MKPVLAGLALLAALLGCTQSSDPSSSGSGSGSGSGSSESTAPAATTVWESRPLPTYTWSRKPSPVVLRLEDEDVPLKAESYCWDGPPRANGTSSGICVRGVPPRPARLPHVGNPEHVDFWFGRPGFRFRASFTELGVSCPRQEDARVESTGDQTFRLNPSGLSGRYRVHLFGRGPGGDAGYSFVWQTPKDERLDQPSGYVGWVSGDRKTGDLWSYGVEVGIDDLGFHPRRGRAKVTATAANGRSTSVDIPLTQPSLRPCSSLGGFYFQTDDPATQDAVDLGPAPFSYRVEMTLDGTTYVGRSTWPDDLIRGMHPNTQLTWEPALPAYEGRR